VTYEYGKPWWNDIDKEKFMIRPPVLSGNHTSGHLVAAQEKLGKKITKVFNMP
jgi:hypothetical protein